MSIAMPIAPEQVESARGQAWSAERPMPSSHEAKTAEPTSSPDSAAFRASVNGHGRLEINELPQTDRHIGVAVHLSPFAAFFFPIAIFAPLVLWLIRKDKSTFVDDHGREMVNVLISSLLISVGGFVGGFLTLGLAWGAAIIWHVIICISMVRGALAAGRGEYFRYPMTFRFLS